MEAEIEQWMRSAGLSVATTARRAGLSPTTLYRVMHGTGSPSLSTVQDIAAACGLEIELRTRRLSTPDAAEAARRSLEGDPPVAPPSDGVERWLLRFAADDLTPVATIRWAAEASAPLARVGAIAFSGPTTVGRLASAGHASGARWAISGAPGLTLPSRQGLCPAPALIWTSDPRSVAQQLGDTHRPTPAGAAPDALVLHADPALFTNSFVQDGVTYASPLQIVIDCLSIPGEATARAEELLRTW